MVRAAAEHSRAPPAELRARRARVGLAVDLPSAVARVELTERTPVDRRAAVRRRVVRDEHLRIFRREPAWARLEHDNARPGFRENVGGHAAPRPRTDDRDVVDRSLSHLWSVLSGEP